MNIVLLLSLCLSAVAAVPARQSRIVGGSVTTIEKYPYAAVILHSLVPGVFSHWCGGTIITNRSILSAAHCFELYPKDLFRTRLGSTYSESGGMIFTIERIIHHPNYRRVITDNDCTVLRVNGNIFYGNNIQPGRLAGPEYNLLDNQPVWAIGWGAIYYFGPFSPNLRHVQIYTINQNICNRRWLNRRPNPRLITANMLCVGELDRGGRNACHGDSGGPLLHHGVVVGIASFAHECAGAHFPTIYARVSRFINWISSQA